MEKIDAISVPFYKFTAEDTLVKEIQEEMKTIEFVSEQTYENGYVYHNYYNKNLFEFFDKSIKEFKKVYFHDDVEFPIVDCWVNKYGRMNKLNRHMHSNSIICGLYYVTTHIERQAATIFEFDNPWVFVKPIMNSFNMSVNEDPAQPLTGEIMPVAGTLILFPPALYHYMKPITKFKEFRYTIAFNTFASGDISMNKSQVLSIKSQSVEDRVKK
jgi:uncharacterized protein (TIGR02466 family)